MFRSIEYLQVGNSVQQKAYDSIQHIQLFEILRDYTPTLTGTIPIEINLPESDLDIILEADDLNELECIVDDHFRLHEGYKKTRKQIKGEEVLKVNFTYNGFPFELFAQNVPVQKQHAYVHMVIEHAILQQEDGMKENVIALKAQGYKTEPAFAKLLGLEGDPYEALVDYGRGRGYL